MKKIYYIDYKLSNGNALFQCETIFGISEKIEEILERDDVILESVVIYTEEVKGDIHEKAKAILRDYKQNKT